MCFTRAMILNDGSSSSACTNRMAARSSCRSSLNHSSVVWCWMMKSISSWWDGCESGICAESSRSSCRYPPYVMRSRKSVTIPGSSWSGMAAPTGRGRLGAVARFRERLRELQLAQRGDELLRVAPRLGEAHQRVSGLLRERAPLLRRETRAGLGQARGDARRQARGAPRGRVGGTSLDRLDDVPGAVGEPLQRLAVDVEVFRRVHRQVADRELLRPRQRRPCGERRLEPGEIELASHRERNELERPVQVALEGEAQVHGAPIRPARGW